jgi:hypothetical protein
MAVPLGHILKGDFGKLFLFLKRNRFKKGAKNVVRTGFDFNKNQIPRPVQQ